MLIVPVSGKIGWKNPPMVTLTLMMINCLVFFFFQTDDDAAWRAAETFYLESGLAGIELPYYLGYLEASGIQNDALKPVEEMDDDLIVSLHTAMESDADFLERLHADRVIVPADAQYDEWTRLRRDFEQKRNQCISFSYGLRPAFPRPLTFITSMFLHGGVGHLVGNMIFLWILGCMLELGSGRLLFTLIFLVSGVLADGFFWMIYPTFTGPLVGASGAIAGLMGAYTVLYGIKRVTVFYSLGFYFDTATVPAILLLPVWLVNECYQLFFMGDSHVAYVAHIGGLLGGAGLALVGEKLMGVKRDRFEEAPRDKVTPLMDRAMEHMGRLEMERAQDLFEEVLALSPGHVAALTHLFNIHKLNPETADFHQAARNLLAAQLNIPAGHSDAVAIYASYADRVRRPSLPISMYLQIAAAMIATNNAEGAEKIVLSIMKHKPDQPALPSTLARLSQAFHDQGRLDRWRRIRRLICKYYPESAEAAMILRSHTPV
jgi:membrane associated rhomboid family serine protease